MSDRLFIKMTRPDSVIVILTTLIVLLGVTDVIHMIFGAYVVNNSYGAQTMCYNVWPFAMLATISSGIVGCNGIFRTMRALNNTRNRDSGVDTHTLANLANIAVLIWGLVIYYNIDDECNDMYDTMYHDLHVFYKITVWYRLAYICVVCSMVCWLPCLIIGTGEKKQVEIKKVTGFMRSQQMSDIQMQKIITQAKQNHANVIDNRMPMAIQDQQV